MAGVNITLSLTGGDVASTALQALARATGDRTPYFKDVGEYLKQSVEQRFREQVDPNRNPWISLSRSTEKKRNKKILTESKRLRRSIVYRASRDQLELGTNVIYAATHQFGRGPIPARPFLGFSDADRDEILTLASEHLERAVERVSKGR